MYTSADCRFILYAVCTHSEDDMHSARVCIYKVHVYSYICTQWFTSVSQVYHFSCLEKCLSFPPCSVSIHLCSSLCLSVEIEGLWSVIDPLTSYYRGQFICISSAQPLICSSAMPGLKFRAWFCVSHPMCPES